MWQVATQHEVTVMIACGFGEHGSAEYPSAEGRAIYARFIIAIAGAAPSLRASAELARIGRPEWWWYAGTMPHYLVHNEPGAPLRPTATSDEERGSQVRPLTSS